MRETPEWMIAVMLWTLSFIAARIVFGLLGRTDRRSVLWSAVIALAIPAALMVRARIEEALYDRRRRASQTKEQEAHRAREKVFIREKNGIAILQVGSRVLDFDESGLLQTSLTALLNEGSKQVIIDLREVTAIFAIGIGAVVRALAEAQKAGADIKFVLSREVHEKLKAVGLASKCEIYPDEDAAVSACRAKSADSPAS